VPAQNYPPFGRCIYCGSTAEPLSNEHIIPLALNGALVLPKASCAACADITKRFEQTVARSSYGPLRIKLGFKTRRKKERPQRLPVGFLDTEGARQETQLAVQHFPTVYLAVEFPPPGIFTGADLSDRNPELTVTLKGDKDEIAHAMRVLEKENIELCSLFSWGPFCRQIAKIGHAFAVASIGTDGYAPLLPDIILGRSECLSHFVGGVKNAIRAEADLSLLLVTEKKVNYLVVYVQLFGIGRLPVYQAVVGKVTDLNVVLTNVARLNSGA
jgi:hypothetical protein